MKHAHIDFIGGKWNLLKQMYGADILEKGDFYVDDIFFTKWIISENNLKGYCINMIIYLHTPPTIYPKKWEDAQGVKIWLSFDGQFGNGLFKLSNRKLIKEIRHKYVRFSFLNEFIKDHRRILIHLQKDNSSIFATSIHVLGISKLI